MMVQPPGVVHRAIMGVGAGRAIGELVQVGLAEQHRAGALEALDRGGVEVRDPVGKERRAVGGGDPSGGVEVLDRDRDAVQRPAMVARHDRRLGRARRLARAVRGHPDVGVEARLEPLDPAQHHLGQLDRRELAGGEARRQLGDRGVGQRLSHQGASSSVIWTCAGAVSASCRSHARSRATFLAMVGRRAR